MFCKTIEKIYRPNIQWGPVSCSWVGYYNSHGSRYMMAISDNLKEDKAKLEEIFNRRLMKLDR